MRESVIALGDWLQQMSEVELHCHLLGTVGRSTLTGLVQRVWAHDELTRHISPAALALGMLTN